MDKERARGQVAALVARFQSIGAAQRRRLKEDAVKQGFILPLFRNLGWNPDDINEVTPEERASNGRVDYAFKLRDVPKFFLEAKAPRENLDAWAEKASEYALHRGVDWVVLTNFAELRLYYALGSASRVEQLIWKSLDCAQFEQSFDDLWLLSRESFESGLIGDLAEKDARLPRRVTLEQSLFAQLQTWRETLINQLLQWHPQDHPKHLSPEQADEIVQRLFNRLIFMRSCEDRGIEPRRLWETLQDVQRAARRQGSNGPLPGQTPLFPTATAGPLLHGLREVFADYRQYYDSELFGRTRYDLHLLDDPDIHLEDTTLQEVLQGLYRVPKRYAQYDFSLIDADIMGRVYEQYLGHVARMAKERRRQQQLRLRAGGQVEEEIQLEAKRQRRKALGIYYTPKWVVEYIVRETVGRMLRELPYAQASQLRVLDPACGSGSFLIRAYDELLRWYAQTTISKSVEALGWSDRIGILTKHIYGVDLDHQAVEIAELNLLLKALAGRNILPVLGENVKRGNSLISGRERELKEYFGEGWREKRPFTWGREFQKVMAEGGFDVVTGNPPYVRIQSLDRREADYFRRHYESAHGSFDIYVLFIEQGLRLLKPGGRLGFITSGKFLKAEYGKRLQGLLRREGTVEEIVDLSAIQVFAEATTYPVMLVVRKGASKDALKYRFVDPQRTEEVGGNGTEPLDISRLPLVSTTQDALTRGAWPLSIGDKASLASRNWPNCVLLGEIAHIFQGLITGADKIFVLKVVGPGESSTIRVQCQATGKVYNLEKSMLRPVAKGHHIGRYYLEDLDLTLLFPYRRDDAQMRLTSLEEIERKYPEIFGYLTENRQVLEDRERGRFRGAVWHGFGRIQNLGQFDEEKILIPYMVNRARAFWDREGKLCVVNVTTGGYGLRASNESQHPFLLAILNSALAHAFLREIGTAHQGGYYGCAKEYLARLPIRRIESATDRELHEAIVKKVGEMLALQERKRPVRGTGLSEEGELGREIERVDGEIDGLVYELYGLTAAERGVVEGV